MGHKKSAPFRLAGLPGAEENGNEKEFTQTFLETQLRNGVRKGSCLQCGRLSHSTGYAGFCSALSVSRSFLFILLPCSCGGFVSRHHEEVPA